MKNAHTEAARLLIRVRMKELQNAADMAGSRLDHGGGEAALGRGLADIDKTLAALDQARVAYNERLNEALGEWASPAPDAEEVISDWLEEHGHSQEDAPR